MHSLLMLNPNIPITATAVTYDAAIIGAGWTGLAAVNTLKAKDITKSWMHIIMWEEEALLLTHYGK